VSGAVDREGLARAVGGATGTAVAALRPIAGGDLNEAFAATLADGRRLFVKSAADAPVGSYAGEAEGLRWLAEPGALPVAVVVAVGDAPAPGDAVAGAPAHARPTPPAADRGAMSRGSTAVRFLALEWIEPGDARSDTAQRLGRGLAGVHAAGAPAFGGPRDRLALGPLELPNQAADGWPAFYAQRRLRPLTRRAIDRGALDPAAARLVDRLADRLPELAGPPEPPARLHGDLWAGNVHVDRDGAPWLIDPAAHGGHREVDLAMLRLFGSRHGSGSPFLAAYEEVAPLADGAEERVALWQLWPLLVHAVLFGGGYGAQALAVLRRYAG